jgi:hypothetical protein
LAVQVILCMENIKAETVISASLTSKMKKKPAS